MKRTKIKDIEINVRKVLDSDFFGAYNSHFIGNGLEFSDLRSYVPGDSVKRIDWKTTARNHEVFVKNFEQERDLNLLFFLDISKHMQFGSDKRRKIETMFELFYTLGFSATKAGDKVGAYIYNGKVHKFFEFKKGEENMQKIANACSDFQYLDSDKKGDDYFAIHIKNLEKLKVKNSLICICTDTLDFETKILRGINARNQILFCNIFDSFENNLGDDSFQLYFKNTIASLSSSFGNDTKKRKYRTLREDKIQALSRKLLSSHIDYLKFDNYSHIYIQFLKYFQQSGQGRK